MQCSVKEFEWFLAVRDLAVCLTFLPDGPEDLGVRLLVLLGGAEPEGGRGEGGEVGVWSEG